MVSISRTIQVDFTGVSTEHVAMVDDIQSVEETRREPPRPARDEGLLEILAELELLRRKASLADARLSRWEARLDAACVVVERLVDAQIPDVDPEERLTGLEARLERLERRRTARPRPAPPAPPPSVPDPLAVEPSSSDAVAIVRARWYVAGAEPTGLIAPGTAVELVAETDGIEAGDLVAIEVRPLGSREVIAAFPVASDGDVVRGQWVVPTGRADHAWCFDARSGRAISTSPPLYVDS